MTLGELLKSRREALGMHSAWHAKLLGWAAKYRMKAMVTSKEPTQTELF